MRRYRAYGLELESEIALPLPESSGGAMPDISLRIDPAASFPTVDPPWEAGGVLYGPLGGGTLVRVRGKADFLVDSASIAVRPGPGIGADESGHLAAMVALGFALQARSMISFHGSAAGKDGVASAVLGDRGAGKSTLVAGLALRGWELLCDDLVVVEPGGFVSPGSARVRLASDSFERLLPEVDSSAIARDADGKLPFSPAGGSERARLGKIFILEAAAIDAIEVVETRGYEKLRAALAHLHSPRGVGSSRIRLLGAAGTLSRLPMYSIRRPVDRFALDESLDALERLARKDDP